MNTRSTRSSDLPRRPVSDVQNFGPSDNTTLVEVVEGYRQSGFTGDFFAEEEALVRCGTCDRVVAAARIPMHSIRRLEGASDPADMIAVVATTCPECGADGTLVVGYGPMASMTDADVLKGMPDRRDDDVLHPSAAPGEAPDAPR